MLLSNPNSNGTLEVLCENVPSFGTASFLHDRGTVLSCCPILLVSAAIKQQTEKERNGETRFIRLYEPRSSLSTRATIVRDGSRSPIPPCVPQEAAPRRPNGSEEWYAIENLNTKRTRSIVQLQLFLFLSWNFCCEPERFTTWKSIVTPSHPPRNPIKSSPIPAPVRVSANSILPVLPPNIHRAYTDQLLQRARRIEGSSKMRFYCIWSNISVAENNIRVIRIIWIYFLILLALIIINFIFLYGNKQKWCSILKFL